MADDNKTADCPQCGHPWHPRQAPCSNPRCPAAGNPDVKDAARTETALTALPHFSVGAYGMYRDDAGDWVPGKRAEEEIDRLRRLLIHYGGMAGVSEDEMREVCKL